VRQRKGVPTLSALRERDQLTIQEMSMVDIVFQLLKEAGEPQSFDHLFNEAAELKGFSPEQKQQLIARLYTEINVDGRFKPLGDNMWGLRSWYPVEQAEEFFVSSDPVRKKKKRDLDEDDYDDLDVELEDELEEEDDYFDDELDVEPDDEVLDDEFEDFDELGDEEPDE
jgi:DNA-directed RNA polymerase subunit delta